MTETNISLKINSLQQIALLIIIQIIIIFEIGTENIMLLATKFKYK